MHGIDLYTGKYGRINCTRFSVVTGFVVVVAASTSVR